MEILQPCKSPWKQSMKSSWRTGTSILWMVSAVSAFSREESSAAGTWAAATVCSVSYQDKLRLLVYAEESQQLIHYQLNYSCNRKGNLKEYGRYKLSLPPVGERWKLEIIQFENVTAKHGSGKREMWEGEKGKRDTKVRKDAGYHPGLQSAVTSCSNVCVFRRGMLGC